MIQHLRRRARASMAAVLAGLLFVSFVPTPSGAAAADYDVIIVFADCGDEPTQLAADLEADPDVATVELFDAEGATPTLEELEPFHLVISMSDCTYADAVAYGDALADYVDQGGVVVQFAYDNWVDTDSRPTGRFEADGYAPFLDGDNRNVEGLSLGDVTDDPLLIGVDEMVSECNTAPELAEGATLVAEWEDGTAAIARKGRVVSNSAHPGGHLDYCAWSGDFATFAVNALRQYIPTITSLAPRQGPTSGGTEVVITGTNFTGATAVTFGGVAATSFKVDSDTQITAVAPAGTAGNANVVVTTDFGTTDDTAADDFTYVAPEPKPEPEPEPEEEPGYRMVAADGGIFTFGDRKFHGSAGDLKLNKPIVGGATDISDNDGYWIVASDGGVFTFNAEFHGSLGGQTLSSPAVEIEPTPTGKGYWIVLADGKVHPFGDAQFFGDMSGKALNKPVIGVSVTPSGKGYWLVAEDGGIFNFGDADFFGSMGNQKLNAPIIDLAPAVDNQGYYLLGRDGGVFTFGSADFKGSTGNMTLNAPVIAMLIAPNGAGYWLAASDGGLFTFGTVPFLGSMGGTKLNSPVLDLIF